MKQEVNREGSKEEVAGHQSPDLARHDEIPIEVEAERVDDFDGASCCRQESSRQVDSTDHGDLHVPRHEIHAVILCIVVAKVHRVPSQTFEEPFSIQSR